MSKRIGMIISTFFILLVIALIGPLDYFTHGFYCDTLDWNAVAEEDFGDSICLDGMTYEMKFSPKDRHFAGFGIYLVNQPEGNSGTLLMSVIDERNRIIDEVKVDLGKVKEKILYRVRLNAELERGGIFT